MRRKCREETAAHPRPPRPLTAGHAAAFPVPRARPQPSRLNARARGSEPETPKNAAHVRSCRLAGRCGGNLHELWWGLISGLKANVILLCCAKGCARDPGGAAPYGTRALHTYCTSTGYCSGVLAPRPTWRQRHSTPLTRHTTPPVTPHRLVDHKERAASVPVRRPAGSSNKLAPEQLVNG